MTKTETKKNPCYCINFRRAANTLTKYYDQGFAGINITTNQFFLLQSISQLESCNKSKLAAYSKLDRTTIIRNLKILERKNLIEEVTGDNKRNKVIQLTTGGKIAITEGIDIWKQLQADIRKIFGDENLSVIWQLFSSIEVLEERE